MFPGSKLTEQQIKDAKPAEKPYKLSVGGALFLKIESNGKKYWRYSYRFMGKPKTYSIGVFPRISLKDALEARDKAKQMLSEGKDPSAEKQEVKKLHRQKAAIRKALFRMDISHDGKLTIETEKNLITLNSQETDALRSFLNTIPSNKNEAYLVGPITITFPLQFPEVR